MEERKKPTVPSFLLGQLEATLQLLEEDVKQHENPNDNSITVAETYFNDFIENPESTLAKIEAKLAPERERLAHPDKIKLIREMKLIYKIKDQYTMTNEHLNEDEFFKGYYQQIKKYYNLD
ncbi:MAG: type I-C CRISPR-associated protein Cas8c/Csd1 [Eubacteriales bacterium]